MPYKNKTYVAFDADSDIRYYRLMIAWKQSDKSDFNFYNAHDLIRIGQHSSEETIKKNLRERLKNSKIFILLVGEKTKHLYKYVKWEIEQAIKLGMPIIVVNLSGKRSLDFDKCPAVIRDKLALHVSFNAKIIQLALEKWSKLHNLYTKQGKTGSYYYNDNVYSDLGL